MEIVGHKKTRAFLRALVPKETLPQSYLFAGPRGVGKKLVAEEFAFQLIGTSSEEGAHPDLLVLSPREEEDEKGRVKKKKLSVEDIRMGLLFLSRYPTLGKRRVLIVDEAEELSPEAANALLKVLEEPNATSIIILVTHRPGALLPTLLSRLVTIPFDLIPETELRAFFQVGKKIPDFFFSLGLPSLIEEALGEPETFRLHQGVLSELFQISTLTARKRLALAEKLSQEENLLEAVLTEWLTGLHFRLRQTKEDEVQKKLLVLFDRIQKDMTSIIERKGNTRLLLEKMLLAF